MQIEILSPSGDILISDIVNGQYIKHRFSGHTKKTAVAIFKKLYKFVRK